VTEQRAIAGFLDAQTARIDTLVAKRRELIEKLKEKRAALISRAVTGGLPSEAARAGGIDPHPRLKPSGIEWLGDVPEHWEVKPLKRAIGFIEGPGILAKDFTDYGIPLLRIAGIGGRTATLNGCDYLSPTEVSMRWSQFRLRVGDLLISGSASTGFCSEVDSAVEGAIPYTGIIIIRPHPNVGDREFIRWFLLSDSFLEQAYLARTGSTIQHFGPSHLSRMSIAVPPVKEQQTIAAFLDSETRKIDAMMAKVEQAVTRLKEYRLALITAAVTGKIDVRGIDNGR
jgi:type I restriction enzyme, S subunit